MRRKQYERIQFLKERDGRNCHLCGLPMWFRAPIVSGIMYKHPCSPSVDHIVPRAHRGPKSDPGNQKLAHKWCNHARGTMAVEDFRSAVAESKHHMGVVVKELVRLCMVPKPKGLEEAVYLESFNV